MDVHVLYAKSKQGSVWYLILTIKAHSRQAEIAAHPPMSVTLESFLVEVHVFLRWPCKPWMKTRLNVVQIQQTDLESTDSETYPSIGFNSLYVNQSSSLCRLSQTAGS